MIQPLNKWMDGIGMPYISREPPARKITSRQAPPYGFSKYSGISWEARTKPPSIRHPGSFRAFRDIRVPEFLDIGRNIRKSHMPAQDDFWNTLRRPPYTESKASIYVRSLHNGSQCCRNPQSLSEGNSLSGLQ